MASVTLRPARLVDERRFFLAFSVVMLATVFTGFARSFFLRPWFPDHPAPAEAVFYVHGTAFALWYLLLVVQASLITSGRVAAHRRLGTAGVGLAAVMVVLGTVGALTAAARPGGFFAVPIPPLVFLVVPLFDMVLFPLFVAVAVLRRRDAQSHKRLMILASITMITAAVARLPLDFVEEGGVLVFFGLTDLFVLALAAWDFASRRRLHPVTLWGGLLLIASQPIRLWLGGTEAWARFAESAVALVR